MCSTGGDGLFGRRIAPFGHPGIKVCLPLPRAYRSLPRPSSPCDAKASTVRPFALVRFFKTFASILTEVAASRPPRSGSQLFASKPRARFDCLEIELLMSSHSNFSRLPLSKIVKSIEEPLFVVAWSHGLIVAWSNHLTIRPFDHQTKVGGRDWS